MYLRKDGAFVRTDVWREGKWLDLWSVVHFLSGMSVGLGFFFLRFGALAASALAFVSFVAYEMWEKLMDIWETPQNRFMDVAVGMASFLPTFFLLAPQFASRELVIVFAAVFLVNVSLAALGWRASQKAAELEARLRARIERERAKHAERRARKRAARATRRAPDSCVSPQGTDGLLFADGENAPRAIARGDGTSGVFYCPGVEIFVTGGSPNVFVTTFMIPYAPKMMTSPTRDQNIVSRPSLRAVSSPALRMKLNTPQRKSANAPAARSSMTGFTICTTTLPRNAFKTDMRT